MNTVTYHCGDIRDVMNTMADRSVDLVVTSPPFLALRSYLPADHPDKAREIGSEPTPAEFLDTLLELTAQWRRLLTPTGSICVELGDTYSGSGGGGGDYLDGGWREGQQQFAGAAATMRESNAAHWRAKNANPSGWPLPKSLAGIPTLYTWSLAYGRNLLTGQPSPAGQWRIRNLIVWHRPNPPVGALGDKVRPSTSYVTVACTSDRRWFDLDSERGGGRMPSRSEIDGHLAGRPQHQITGSRNDDGQPLASIDWGGKSPPLDAWHHTDDDPADVWTIPTQPYAGAHYATFPVALPRRLINLMCPRQVCTVCGEARRRIVDVSFTPHGVRNPNEPRLINADHLTNPSAQGMAYGRVTKNSTTLGWSDCGHDAMCPRCLGTGQSAAAGVFGPCPMCNATGHLDNNFRPGHVLDPFAGTGTTALAATQLGRDAICIDIDPRNIALTRHRIGDHVAILAETGDGPTTTWTVEAALPGTKGETEGQLNLFAQ